MRNSTTYKLAGPKTFRRASTIILRKWGSNLQNVEKSLRNIYIADGFNESLSGRCKYFLETGDYSVFTEEELASLRVLINVDQAGAEALIVAYECEAGDYRKLFVHGVKPHVYVALKLFLDTWKDKAKQHKIGITSDDIDILGVTPIEKLKNNTAWKPLDSLIKSSDNWNASERYYYLAKQTCHCVDKETEVLTKSGWKFIANLSNVEEIATYNNRKIQFEFPTTKFIYPYSGKLLHFIGDEVDQLVTPNHKMVYWSNNKINIDEARYVKFLKRVNIPTGGMYVGGSVTLQEWQVKLLVAIQADGEIQTTNQVRFRFTKDRKINRLHDILNEGKLEYTFNPYTDVTTANNIVSEFTVKVPDLIAMFKGNKVWDSWLLDLSKSNLLTLINELCHWDGTYTETYLHKRVEYISAKEQNINWIKTICHLLEMQGTIGKQVNGCIKLGLNNRMRSTVSLYKEENYFNFVYCVEVPSGMFLIRRNGKISVTHNSANYGIEGGMFQMNILEKSGGKIVISKDEASRFLELYRGLFPEIPARNNRIRHQVETTKVLYNLFGFPYQITNYNIIESTFKEYYAWSAQSTVGEITRQAFTKLYEHIKCEKKHWDILQDNHDSYLCQVPLSDVKECTEKMTSFMNVLLESPIDGTKFNMRSECQVGFNWGPFKKGKNDLGLREINW